MTSDTKKLKPVFLLILALLFLAFQATGIVIESINYVFDQSWIAISVLDATLCFLLYFSYKSHAKNIMKPALGGVLAIYLFAATNDAFYYIQYLEEVIENSEMVAGDICFAVLSILSFASILIINILHYVMNASHKSNSICVKLNKICFILNIIAITGTALTLFLYYKDLLYSVCYALTTISDLFALAIIIAIEASLDYFKKEREIEADPDESEITLPKKSKASSLFVVALLYGAFIYTSFITYSLLYKYFDYSWFSCRTITFLFSLGICFAYHRHTKNVMKPFVGAVLALVIKEVLDVAFSYTQYFDDMIENYPSYPIGAYMICEFIICAFAIIYFVLFVATNATHKSSPVKVKWIKYSTAAIIIFSVLQSISVLFINEEVLLTVDYMCYPIGMAFAFCLITLILNSLEKHREAREMKAATEEAV